MDEPASIGFGNLVNALRRRWFFIMSCAVVGVALAAVYVALATPMFTATSSILLDTRMNQFLQKQDIMSDVAVDSSFVDSQAEVLTSDSIALTVVQKLGLAHDQEFVGPPKGAVGVLMWKASKAIAGLKSALGLSSDDSAASADDTPERIAVETFAKRLTIKRVGMTYVIDIAFASEDPDKSARIANAVADAYIAQGLDSKVDSTRRAATWLQDRLKELKTQAAQADAAVQQFKSTSNIVDTGRGLMSQQQLADLNSQLVVAKTATAEAKARLDRIQHVEGNSLLDGTVTDALNNSVITRLRAQYLDLSAQEASLSQRLGPNHQAAVKLRDQMGELRNSIANEVQRIAAAYASDYAIAVAREKSLNDSMAGLVDENDTSNIAQVKLRDLESSADTYRTLYDSYLQKFQESIQQQSAPVTDTRIITLATPPLFKSSPKTLLFIAAGLMLGLFAGAGTTLARELTADVFRSSDEVERGTGFECLGTAPAVKITRKSRLRRLRDGQRWGDRRSLAAATVCENVLDEPFSRFSEALRNVKVSIDGIRLTRDVRVIGIVSAIPGEGKTTIAGNLASLVASTGHRTLLIDADLHRKAATSAFARDAGHGLLEALADPLRLADLVQTRSNSGLDVLPCVTEKRPVNAAEILGSAQMNRLLTEARNVYDYVFVDFAALMPVVDAKAAAHLVDGFVYVAEWGSSSRKLVLEALSSSDVIRERLIGILLNRAEPSALRQSEAYRGKAFQAYYAS
ncbi:Wzz/FepE/Etk N-terminal domain-containing protein [Labrys miyagiensis]|nr:Wzz/FepE/Etk N-terminal domain-containing protein [Labrys miyagiensis]